MTAHYLTILYHYSFFGGFRFETTQTDEGSIFTVNGFSTPNHLAAADETSCFFHVEIRDGHTILFFSGVRDQSIQCLK
jgi:hypothetical protein